MSTQSAETLIVHGHGLTPDEGLDLHTTQRMDTALSAWRNDVAPMLTMSGGYSFMLSSPPSRAEATVMKEYALQNGIPEESLAVEDKSLDTVGNVLLTKTQVVLPNDWERLVVVTSKSHLPRTLDVYKHVFGREFDIQGIAAPEQIGIKEKIYEPLGAAMVNAVLKGTKPGDHEAVQERLFDMVPGYADGSISKLALKSLLGLFKKS